MAVAVERLPAVEIVGEKLGLDAVGADEQPAALEPDEGPHPSFCGTCSACIEACPTGAIVSDGVVDANLCISYWTIEHRGGVPEARRAGIGDWIFGCDVCQDVCPWNRSFAVAEPGDPLERRDDLAGLDPEAILAEDEVAGLAQRFRESPPSLVQDGEPWSIDVIRMIGSSMTRA